MLLAIDVGNTHTVCGLWNGSEWCSLWRRTTGVDVTEDEVVVWLKGLFDLNCIPWKIDAAVCASVVPRVDRIWDRLVERWFGVRLRFLRAGDEVGLKVDYDPPDSVGADRLANALAAVERFTPPIVVIDFGTATNFDVVDRNRSFVGGAILPGLVTSSQALFGTTARLPRGDLSPPSSAIGRSTAQALQSGIMLAYAGGIDSLAGKMNEELGGGAKIVATGGLGGIFMGLCSSIESYEPTLTLDGLVVASTRFQAADS